MDAASEYFLNLNSGIIALILNNNFSRVVTIILIMDFDKICQNTEKEMRKELEVLKKEIHKSLQKPKLKSKNKVRTEKLGSIL